MTLLANGVWRKKYKDSRDEKLAQVISRVFILLKIFGCTTFRFHDFFLFYAVSATSSRSTSPTPPRVLRRPNIIVEDDRRYSRASALSLDKLLAARSARLAARSPVTERASFAYDK